VTPEQVWAIVQGAGSPVLVGIFVALVLLQFFSERVAKALGPILGAVGRWWHGREQRQEEQLQKELAAREATVGQRAAFQLEDMERQLRYFTEVVEKLRAENAQLRDELHTVHRLLDDTLRGVDETRRGVQEVKRVIDTGERLAVLPPPPPVAGRHHANRHQYDPDATSRIDPAK
jgi:hypothetical protein